MEALPLIILTATLLVAVWTDQRSQRIPNALILTMLVSGCLVRGVLEGSAGLVDGLTGLLAGFLVLIIPYLLRGMAAGDVKLLAAVGLFVGPVTVVIAGLMATLIGACIGGALITMQRYRESSAAMEQLLAQRFPFAVSIALGTATALILRGQLS